MNELMSSFRFSENPGGVVAFWADYGPTEQDTTLHPHALIRFNAADGRYEVFVGTGEETLDEMLSPNYIAHTTNTEMEARTYCIGWSLITDYIVVGKPGETASCEKAVVAFAEGLQDGCNSIASGGPQFVPVRFPEPRGR